MHGAPMQAGIFPDEIPVDWQAAWIWYPGQSWAANVHWLARKAFSVTGEITRARLHISAYTDYHISLNGVFIGRGPIPCDPWFQFYDTYNVTSVLQQGSNVLGAIAHNMGLSTHQQFRNKGGLIVQLEIETTQGKMCIASDQSWRAAQGACWRSSAPRIFWSAGFTEVFDATVCEDGWDLPGFDDTHWMEPELLGKHPVRPWTALLPREIPHLVAVPISVERIYRGTWNLPAIHCVNFSTLHPSGQHALVYAETAFFVPERREVILHIGCDDAFRAFLNGIQVVEQNYDEQFARTRTWRGTDDYDQVHYGIGQVEHDIPVVLDAGWNTLCIVVDHGPGGWGLTCFWRDLVTQNILDLPCRAGENTQRWHIVGPFPSTEMHDSLDTVAKSLAELDATSFSYDPFDYTRPIDQATLMACEKRSVGPELLPEHELTLDEGEYVILDLGKIHVSYPAFTLEGTAGAVLDIGYSHVLRADHTITFYDRMKYVDRLYLRAGEQSWQPLQRRTGRYLHLSCRKQRVVLRGLQVSSVSYPVQPVARFECADPVLNTIWETSRYTTQLVMQDGYQDCLKREEGTFNTSSFNYASRSAACCFGDHALARKSIRLALRTQEPNGWFDSHGLSGLNNDEISECLWLIVWLRDYFLFSGDRAFIAEVFEQVEANLRFFTKLLSRQGVLDGRNWHLTRRGQSVYLDDVITYVDPTTMPVYNGAFPGELSGLNMLYYAALEATATLAEALDLTDQKRRYQRMACHLYEGINRRFWDDARGCYIDWRQGDQASEHGHPIMQITALYFNLADSTQQEKLLRRLCDDLGLPDETRSDYPLQTFGYYFYFLEVLFRYGRSDLALELLRRYYGRWLELGATTFGEHLRLDWIRGKTQLTDEYEVHAYGTSAHLHFYTNLLGVQPAESGFAQICFVPHPGDLAWARGTVSTPQGLVQVAWEQHNGRFQLTIDLPEHVTYEVMMPDGYEVCQLIVNGKVREF